MKKRYKAIDAVIKTTTLKTAYKKWNKILEATEDAELIEWVDAFDQVTGKFTDEDFFFEVEWTTEDRCYISLILYREVA